MQERPLGVYGVADLCTCSQSYGRASHCTVSWQSTSTLFSNSSKLLVISFIENCRFIAKATPSKTALEHLKNWLFSITPHVWTMTHQRSVVLRQHSSKRGVHPGLYSVDHKTEKECCTKVDPKAKPESTPDDLVIERREVFVSALHTLQQYACTSASMPATLNVDYLSTECKMVENCCLVIFILSERSIASIAFTPSQLPAGGFRSQ